MRMRHFIVGLGLPLAIAACAKDEQHRGAAAPTSETTVAHSVARTTAVFEPVAGEELQRTSIEVSPEIARQCELPEAHFPFDSAEITGSTAAALDRLAECFTSGALSGRTMRIIGHADPRGTMMYNFGLGQRRADAVADYLGDHGLGEGRIETSSLGELEATGTDEAGWARDRKVEILLADEAIVLQTPAEAEAGEQRAER